jgi:hypothetical protein
LPLGISKGRYIRVRDDPPKIQQLSVGLVHNHCVDAKERSGAIRNAIRQILMQKWDPIGVKDVPEAADEYDMYIDDICCLLKREASDEELSKHLVKIETERMGLSDANGKPLLPETLREQAIRELQSVPGSQR